MSNDSFIRPDEFWRQLGLRAEQTVVHLGCGPGFYLIPAAHIIGKSGKATGVDILSDMLAEVENRAEREGVAGTVQTRRANLEANGGSGLSDNSADWVLVANILHQADPSAILREAARVVAANGKVVVVEWDTSASPFGPPASSRRSPAEVIELAAAAGLAREKSWKPSPYHYGLVLSKSQ